MRGLVTGVTALCGFMGLLVMEHCSIIGRGEMAQELKDGAEAQRETCEQAKKLMRRKWRQLRNLNVMNISRNVKP